MAFLAALKKGSKDNPFAKFKEKEEEKEAVYIPLAECASSGAVTAVSNDDAKQENVDDVEAESEHKDGDDDKLDGGGQSESKRVSIACISDVHMKLEELKMVPADILVLSGDFTNNGTLKEAETVNEWLGAMRTEHGYKAIVSICGNHEGYGDILISDELMAIEQGETECIGNESKRKEYEQQEAVRAQSQRHLAQSVMTNVDHFLYDEAVTVGGVRFYGSPWTPNLLDPQDRGNKKHFDRGFHADVPSMKRIWSRIPDDTEYLVVHGPPQGILDINGKGGSMLRLRVAELEQLRVCQFGHVHSGYGWSVITKQSLRSSIEHIDQSQPFERVQVDDLENIKYAEDLPFPIKLDKDTRTGKTLTQFRSEDALKKAVNEQNVDLVEDVVLFVNAATDGYEQPIHFKLTL